MSAGASNSHTAASDNSNASSAAVAELADGLGFLLDNLTFDEEPGDILQLHLGRLQEEAGKYRNSRLDDLTGSEWSCSQADGRLIYAACRASSHIYKAEPSLTFDLIPVMDSPASIAGTSKATFIWKHEKSGSLVVAVRGTACAADHMVNLNTEPVDATPFLGTLNGVLTTRAHGGFLSSATTLASKIETEIDNQIQLDPTIEHVVFTGHSAGGAVSALLFLAMANLVRPSLVSKTLSLITFGSPPVSTLDVTNLAKKLPNVGMVLSFVNEFDMVPRADHEYIRSIIDLYRARYGLPPVLHTAFQRDLGLEGGEWPLPSPRYHPIGDILLLRVSSSGDFASEHKMDSDAVTLPGQSSHCTRLSLAEFTNLVFCDIAVHKRCTYLERIEELIGNRTRVLTTASQATTLVSY